MEPSKAVFGRQPHEARSGDAPPALVCVRHPGMNMLLSHNSSALAYTQRVGAVSNPASCHLFKPFLRPVPYMYPRPFSSRRLAVQSLQQTSTAGLAHSPYCPHLTSSPPCLLVFSSQVPRVLAAKARGHACFDFDLYVAANDDLAAAAPGTGWTRSALWKHFVYFGQFEARPHRFTCGFDHMRLLRS
eukprot:358009-Chlamydomonas_euryale.AAC.4